MIIIRIKSESFLNLKGVDSNMTQAKCVTEFGTTTDLQWENVEKAKEFYEQLWGLNREYSFADPGRDYTVEKAERSESLGGMEVNLDLIRNYQAKRICRRCWALRTLGQCIYGFSKVKVQKTVFRKKWERKEIVKHNAPSVKRSMDWRKYREGLKKIYKAYRKGMFRSRWTLHKLINQLVDKCSKNEVVVYETIAEEKWIFKGLEQFPVEFELVCPVKILFGSADFVFDIRDYINERADPKAPDHFQSWAVWDDDEREYIESDKVDNSETIETEEETETDKKIEYVCDNCDLKDSCKYAFDEYCKFECLLDK